MESHRATFHVPGSRVSRELHPEAVPGKVCLCCPAPRPCPMRQGEREACKNCAGIVQEGCRKDAGSTPHSLPDYLFSFHHFSFWQTGTQLNRRLPSQLLHIPAAVALPAPAISAGFSAEQGQGAAPGLLSSLGFSLAFPKELHVQSPESSGV